MTAHLFPHPTPGRNGQVEGLVYINGELVPREEARISVFDHGFLYGNGLFETMRAYQGRIFRVEHHLQRLFLALDFLQFPIPFTFDSLKKALYRTIEANRLTDAYIRLNITRGEGATIPDPTTCKSPNLIIITREYVPYSPALYQKGYRAKIVQVRPSAQTPAITMKTANFINNIIAKKEAKESGCNEGIMVNTDGFITESTVSNIFLVQGNRLSTPGREVGLLPGVTRQAVLELAGSQQLQIEEGKFIPGDLCAADEAFLTNSLIEIMPLVEVDGHPIGPGTPGPVTRGLMVAYKELVERELKR